MSFILILIIGALVLKIISMQSAAKKEIIRDQGNSFVQRDTEPELKEKYFRMRMDRFLKKKYPKLLGWEFLDTFEIHYTSISNRVMIHIRDDDQAITIPSLQVWQDGYERTEDELPDEDNDNNDCPENPNGSPVIQWITDNINAIESQIQKFKDLNMVYTEYTVDGEPEFVEQIAEHLRDTTPYDISISEEKKCLIINFQALCEN